MIEIMLNGESAKCKEGANIIDLLHSLEIEMRSVAIELNLEIIPKSKWGLTIIKPDDKIEIVQFVGGGI